MTMRVNITREHGWYTAKDWVWEFTMKDETGAVVDITGWALAVLVKAKGSNASSPALFPELSGASVPVTDGPNGVFQVIGTDDLTEAPGIGNKTYQGEIRRTDAGNERVSVEGDWYLIQSLSG